MKGIELAGPLAQDGLRFLWDPRRNLPRIFYVAMSAAQLGFQTDGIVYRIGRRAFRQTDRVTRDGQCFIYTWAHDEVL